MMMTMTMMIIALNDVSLYSHSLNGGQRNIYSRGQGIERLFFSKNNEKKETQCSSKAV